MKKLILVALALTGCGPWIYPPMPVEPDDTDKCPAACERLRALGCEEGEPLSDGTTCEKFCLDTQKAGHSLNPSCVMTISTCDEVETKCAQNRKERLEP